MSNSIAPPRANYFIGLKLPITTELTNSVYAIQQEIRERNNLLSKIFSKPNKLHLTLAVLHIDQEERIPDAIEIFQNSINELRTLLDDNYISFPTIKAFGAYNNRRVIWLEPENGITYNNILQYSNYISTKFTEASFPSTPSDVLHATIANKYSNKKLHIKETDYRDLTHHLTSLPCQQLNQIDLLKIGETDPFTGYYPSLCCLYIHSPESSSGESKSDSNMIAVDDDL